MYNVILGLHIFVCFLLIIAVLLQNSKSGDLGSAFGGGSGGDMFGPKAPANIMNRITTVIAACFLILSLTLAVLSGLGSSSVLRSIPLDTQAPILPTESTSAPIAPAAQAQEPASSGQPAEESK